MNTTYCDIELAEYITANIQDHSPYWRGAAASLTYRSAAASLSADPNRTGSTVAHYMPHETALWAAADCLYNATNFPPAPPTRRNTYYQHLLAAGTYQLKDWTDIINMLITDEGKGQRWAAKGIAARVIIALTEGTPQ